MTDLLDQLFTMTKRRSFGYDTPEASGLPQELRVGGGGMIEQIGFLGDSVVDSAQVAAGALDSITKFADTIRPPEVVAALPTLPSATYPEGSFCFLTTDGKLYRNVADSWTSAVDAADLTGHVGIPLSATAPTLPDATNYPIGSFYFNTTDKHLYKTTDGSTWGLAVDSGDIVADSITAGQIAAGAIGTTELAANAVTAAKIAANTITANEIAANTLTAGEIAAGAIGVSELAADAVTAHAIEVSGSATDNLFPDPLMEWAGYGDLSGWEALGSQFSFPAVSASTLFKRGTHRLQMNTTSGASTTTQTRSNYIPVNGYYSVDYYTIAVESAVGSYTSGNVTINWYAYNSSLTLIGSGTCETITSATSWPHQTVYRLKTNGASNPSDGTTIDAELPANTAYIKIGFDDDGSATQLSWNITYAGFFKGLIPYWSNGGPSTWDSTYSSVALNANGILIRNGRLVVVNPSATVIIDGTSNMFKIAATGTQSRSVTQGTIGTTTVTTLTGLGTFTATPGSIAYVSTSSAATGNKHPGRIEWASVGPTLKYASSTSGGTTNQQVLDLQGMGTVYTYLNGSSQCVVELWAAQVNNGMGTITYYDRYYVLVEAAL